jgi:hypothetical protein
MVKGKAIGKEARTLCLTSLETGRSLADLLPNKEERKKVFGSTQDQRRRVTNYRNKLKRDRQFDQRGYVEACIKHGVRIESHGSLLEIETELLWSNNQQAGIMAPTSDDEENYAESMDLLNEVLSGGAAGPKAGRRSTRGKATPPVKSMTGKTATLSDRARTVVPVDLVVPVDIDSPWMTLLGSLLTYIPEVKVDDGNNRYAMGVYEFAANCIDPRDANLRSMRVVDDGNALLYKLEIVPLFNREDPESLAQKPYFDRATNQWSWPVRCACAQDEYKALMTKINSPDKSPTISIKFLLPDAVTTDFFNPGTINGSLDMDYNLVTTKLW